MMKTPKVNNKFIVQKIKENTVVFNSEDSKLYTLNETSSFIYSRLKLELPIENIIVDLTKNYRIGEEEARKDVFELIKDLQIKGILINAQSKKSREKPD